MGPNQCRRVTDAPHPPSKERASAEFRLQRPGVSLWSSAPELGVVQQCCMVYNGRGQVILKGDKEETQREERERERTERRALTERIWRAWKDRSVGQILGYFGYAIQGFPFGILFESLVRCFFFFFAFYWEVSFECAEMGQQVVYLYMGYNRYL